MTPNREMVVMAVLEGALPDTYLTASEVAEVLILVQEAAMEKKMQDLHDAGGSVFWGMNGGDTLQ
jgi:hypothetical protein